MRPTDFEKAPPALHFAREWGDRVLIMQASGAFYGQKRRVRPVQYRRPANQCQLSTANTYETTLIRRIILTLLGSAAAMSILNSCHTAEGIGEDVQHAGRGIERAAHRAH
jgi:predicted small secreted protein